MKSRIERIILVLLILVTVGLAVDNYRLRNRLDDAEKKIQEQVAELIKVKQENDVLWDNYYMNIGNYEGYEYYE